MGGGVDLSSLSESGLEALVDFSRMPRHIGIVMDGNGRWAQERGLPRVDGHRAAVKSVWEIVDACGRMQLDALTLYAFSTENWKRPPSEVRALMHLLRQQLRLETPRLRRNNVTLRGIGDTSRLPMLARWELARSERRLRGNTGLVLNLALSYGGRQEILQAVKSVLADIRRGVIAEDDLTEERFRLYLETGVLPDPDLIIRTSGEQRLSNFLLWQGAYAELVFTPTMWPDFRRRDLLEAIVVFQRRDRRFGAVKPRTNLPT
ncbi:isoprenyl transferase [Candidatus Poribacteria bacterium]|nr:isoprenyl transferase [Candidatus Poribacteria bacterium]